ncbi:MAG TPA: DNA polymerase III subunit alpha [Gammaproteobacteria bacterium]|nr:DNA polymerase III subunit alpha [Gammaproteobacteria bacterium]
MALPFVHLRVHTEYSLVDSVVRVDPLVEALERTGMPAVALTDEGNVSAMVKFYKAALERGIKPIVGADVWVAESPTDADPARLTLLCTSKQGFKNLSRLLTKAYTSLGMQSRALLQKAWLDPAALEGLIALSGAQQGEVGKALVAGRPERARDALAEWRERMPSRFYVELQRLGRAGEAEYLEPAVRLAADAAVPIVATNEVCFLERDDFEAHETRVCIGQGRTLEDAGRPRLHSDEQFLKSAAEMERVFRDLPEALSNTLEIAMRCNLELELGQVFLPAFDVPGGASAQEHLRERAALGLEERLAAAAAKGGDGALDAAGYRARLERELDVICKMGFEGYFLIVADFINWARQSSIPVGPGRGSGAGSLVAYALKITDLDPIEHDLLFERFLNPERVSMPDFDIDFCIEGRDRVIGYVGERYGRDRVSQIITHGTMAARAVVRDVGRVFGMPYGYVDRIAKLIPFELGMTLDRALAESEELRTVYEAEDEVRELVDMARRLEGLARNAGTHAGGVVIAPAPLTEFMPLYAEQGAGLLTQLDKDDVEAIGLVKFDFLGLKTLTIIDKALATINRERAAHGLPPVDVGALPVDDPKAYELLNRGRTTAVFQFESRGMRDLIKRLKPDRFEDLVSLNALFRPGPLQSGMVEEFISRKHARTGIDYLHPSLEPVLKPTYGVIVYQEQVMQIARVLAGYSLGGADLLRRAMGKKKPEEMAKQRSIFVAGAVERGIEEKIAAHIFDLMEKFAGYGFNKSHAAAYALIAYQTAWLKAHYTAAFMAAVMTADMDNTDKLVVLKDECTALGLALDPPNVNRSAHAFTVAGPKRISYGLGAVKGVGQAAVDAIVAEREAGGPFTSLLDLCRRVDSQKLNRRVLEALARAGALDGLGTNRATLMKAVPDALRLAEHSAHALAGGQGALFGGDDEGEGLEHEFEVVREWTKRERLEAERESLGLYLTGHPFEEVAAHCKHFTNGPIAGVVGSLPADGANSYAARREVTLAGVVMDVRRRGNRVSIVLDDDTERIEASLFDEVYASCKHLVAKHAVLVVRGQLRFDDYLGAWRIGAQRVSSVDDEIEEHARRITIVWSGLESRPDFVPALKDLLKPFTRGKCEVCLKYRGPAAEALLTLGEEWNVRPTRELRERLARLLGDESVSVHYPKHFV